MRDRFIVLDLIDSGSGNPELLGKSLASACASLQALVLHGLQMSTPSLESQFHETLHLITLDEAGATPIATESASAFIHKLEDIVKSVEMNGMEKVEEKIGWWLDMSVIGVFS